MVTRHLIKISCLLALATACAPRSPTPVVEDLVKVRAPTFNHSLSATITSPSISYVVHGECDSAAYLTEYKVDEAPWTLVDCVNDAFSFAVKVNGFIKVSARARGKFSYSDVSHANVRFILPPTSDSVLAVASSKSDSTDLIGVGTQNTLGSTFEGKSASNSTMKIHSYLPRVVYEQ